MKKKKGKLVTTKNGSRFLYFFLSSKIIGMNN